MTAPKYRLPRKGDRIAVWVLQGVRERSPWCIRPVRVPVTVEVLQRRRGLVHFADATGTIRVVRAEPAQILPRDSELGTL